MDFDENCAASRAFTALWEEVERLQPGDLGIPRPLARNEFEELFLEAD